MLALHLRVGWLVTCQRTSASRILQKLPISQRRKKNLRLKLGWTKGGNWRTSGGVHYVSKFNFCNKLCRPVSHLSFSVIWSFLFNSFLPSLLSQTTSSKLSHLTKVLLTLYKCGQIFKVVSKASAICNGWDPSNWGNHFVGPRNIEWDLFFCVEKCSFRVVHCKWHATNCCLSTEMVTLQFYRL